MKQTISIFVLALLVACNSSKKDKPANEGSNTSMPSENTNTPGPASTTPAPGASRSSFTVDGKQIDLHASALVQKDKKNMQAGSDYLVVMTSSGGPNNESITLNFVMALKPGTYPLVGMGATRGPSGEGEVYGGILGGEEKLTGKNVTITECNKIGDHRWSISGTFEDITIPAMGIMLMDKSKNHPAEIKLEKGSFSNLTFDDNWEELMQKAMDQMKKNN